MATEKCDDNCPSCTNCMSRETVLMRGKVVACADCGRKFCGPAMHLIGGKLYCHHHASIRHGQEWNEDHWLMKLLLNCPMAFCSTVGVSFDNLVFREAPVKAHSVGQPRRDGRDVSVKLTEK